MRLTAISTVLALAAAAAHAQTPYLVRDINPHHGDSRVGEIEVLGGAALFPAYRRDVGRELWRSDGTAAGTALVKDLLAGAQGGDPEYLTPAGSRMFFFARGTGGQLELWKTDATSAGTLRVAVWGMDWWVFGKPVILGGNLYTILTGSNGMARSLVRSDGTAAGTAELIDMCGATGCTPCGGFGLCSAELAVAGSFVFFAGHDAAGGWELWRSDGTAAGTARVRDIAPGTASGVDEPFPAWAVIGSEIYFPADDGLAGRELWRSDGTTAGTRLVRDILPGSGSSIGNPWLFEGEGMASLGGRVFFQADDGVSGGELWASDGSSAGTTRIADLDPAPGAGSDPRRFESAGGLLFFLADAQGANDLWRSNGTAAGTFRLAAAAAVGSPYRFRAAGALAYFAAAGASTWALWRSDGTAAGTLPVLEVPFTDSGWISGPAALGNLVLTGAPEGPRAIQLWRSDGSSAGTRIVTLINDEDAEGSHPARPLVVGDELWFSADDGSNGEEVWRTDGTMAGTIRVSDSAGLISAAPLHALPAGVLYSAAADLASGVEPWMTAGVVPGSAPLVDICRPGCSSTPEPLLERGGIAYFSADDQGFSSRRLWRSDGTGPGTVPVVPGGGPLLQSRISAAELAGVLYFPAEEPATGRELWRSDGTGPGTYLVDDTCPGSCSSRLTALTAVGSRLFYISDEGLPTAQLWRKDGSGAGATLVPGVVPVHRSNLVRELGRLGDTLLFFAQDGSGEGLFRSDGTAAGTTRIRALSSNLGVFVADPPLRWACEMGGRLYFAAGEGARPGELWSSDGTAAGTYQVKDIRIGGQPAWPAEFVAVGDLLYFFATDDVAGTELWRSDGTDAGTWRVADIDPAGPPAGIPLPSRWLARAGTRLYFPADDGVDGVELWALDLPRAPRALLRNAFVRDLDPFLPARDLVLPLDPARDAYDPGFFSGAVDREGAVVPDASRPLIFYALDGPGTLSLVKAPLGALQIRF